VCVCVCVCVCVFVCVCVWSRMEAVAVREGEATDTSTHGRAKILYSSRPRKGAMRQEGATRGDQLQAQMEGRVGPGRRARAARRPGGQVAGQDTWCIRFVRSIENCPRTMYLFPSLWTCKSQHLRSVFAHHTVTPYWYFHSSYHA